MKLSNVITRGKGVHHYPYLFNQLYLYLYLYKDGAGLKPGLDMVYYFLVNKTSFFCRKRIHFILFFSPVDIDTICLGDPYTKSTLSVPDLS